MTPLACIPSIVSQFSDACACLYEQRERTARSEVFLASLRDLTAVDDRLDAQLDGLRTSGEAGWAAALDALRRPGSGEVFTAAALAFARCSSDRAARRRNELLQSAIDGSLAFARPMALALCWLGRGSLEPALARLRTGRDPFSRAVTTTAASMAGVDCESAIVASLEGDDPDAVQAACWAAVRARFLAVAPLLESHVDADDPATRTVAAYCAFLMRSERARRALESIASDGTEATWRELAAAALLRSTAPDDARAVHRNLFGSGSASRTSLKAAGASGARDLVPVVLDQVECPSLARAAADAFAAITGVRTTTTEPPADGFAGPSDDPDDDCVSLDPDEGVPWPAAGDLAAWWRANHNGFEARTRYLEGVPVTDESVRALVRHGGQARRAAAAEIFTRLGGPWFDVCAPSFIQLAWFVPRAGSGGAAWA